MKNQTTNDLHFFLFPFMSQGHIIPLIKMAKIFASRDQKVTIITTPLNAPGISKSIESTRIPGHEIDILTIDFPCVEAGVPLGCESLDLLPSSKFIANFCMALDMLAQPVEDLLKKYRPDCLISDSCFTWSNEVASKFGIPRIAFNGFCFFSSSATLCMTFHQPYKNVSSDAESFVIPIFPGEIKFTKNQLPDFCFTEFYRKMKESDAKSYGLLVNSFYELEPDYADHFRNVLGIKAWHIGPISLWDSSLQDEVSSRNDECLDWLNSRKPTSIVYLCFGSLTNLLSSQLLEIAKGLEDSGLQFIWVVKKRKDEPEDWLPDGFEKRMEGKGLIIRGWAPQVMILEHKAVGGFVTHCGWNSTLEAVTAGVPMVTWPFRAEQFYNEKLITEVLGIGVSVGAQKWAGAEGDGVNKQAIAGAVTRVMLGEEAEKIRSRANKLGELARKAVSEGGSSCSDFIALIDELKSKKV